MQPALIAGHHQRNDPDFEPFMARVLADPDYRHTLEFCWRTGVAPSVFIGRVPEAGEPLFTDADRSELLLWARFDAERCSQCGLHPLQWPVAYKRGKAPFDVSIEVCHPCREIARASKRETGSGSKKDNEGLGTAGMRPKLTPTGEQPAVPGWHPELLPQAPTRTPGQERPVAAEVALPARRGDLRAG